MTGSDETLVSDCLDGNGKAFEALIEKYETPVFNLAFRMADDHEDARDITHTAFLKAFQNLKNFNPRYRFYSWLYRIAVNESLNLLNQRRNTEVVDDRVESDRRSPEDEAHGAEVSRVVQRALMNIKADHRAVIILRHFLECSYAEIASVLEIPEKTVKSRLFTARQQLREALAKEGVSRP